MFRECKKCSTKYVADFYPCESYKEWYCKSCWQFLSFEDKNAVYNINGRAVEKNKNRALIDFHK